MPLRRCIPCGGGLRRVPRVVGVFIRARAALFSRRLSRETEEKSDFFYAAAAHVVAVALRPSVLLLLLLLVLLVLRWAAVVLLLLIPAVLRRRRPLRAHILVPISQSSAADDARRKWRQTPH